MYESSLYFENLQIQNSAIHLEYQLHDQELHMPYERTYAHIIRISVRVYKAGVKESRRCATKISI
jgi:hypothetical protein